MEFTISPRQLNTLVKSSFDHVNFTIKQGASMIILSKPLSQARINFTPLSIQREGHLQLLVKELKKSLKLFNTKDPVTITRVGYDVTLSQGYNSKKLSICSDLLVEPLPNTKPLLTMLKSNLKPFVEYLKQSQHVRKALYCLLLDNGNIVACDGLNLLVKKHSHSFDGKYLIDVSYLIPVLQLAKDTIDIAIVDNLAVITAGDYTLTAPLSKETYPDYTRLRINSANIHSFDISSNPLLQLARTHKSFVIKYSDDLESITLTPENGMGVKTEIFFKQPKSEPDHPLEGGRIWSKSVLPFLQMISPAMITAKVNGNTMQFECGDTSLTYLVVKD